MAQNPSQSKLGKSWGKLGFPQRGNNVVVPETRPRSFCVGEALSEVVLCSLLPSSKIQQHLSNYAAHGECACLPVFTSFGRAQFSVVCRAEVTSLPHELAASLPSILGPSFPSKLCILK